MEIKQNKSLYIKNVGESVSEQLSHVLMSEETFVTKVFVQMFPMDAVWRERILLALGGSGIA